MASTKHLTFRTPVIISVVILFVALYSCAGDGDENPDVFSDTSTAAGQQGGDISPLAGCYTMTQNRDTAYLTLSVKDTIATGKLQYKRFEKDHNDGILKGVIRNGVLVAHYIFQSEGTQSVRDVAFYIKGDSLFEGYGEVKVAGDSAKFVDTENLKLLTTPFIKVPCHNR